MTAKKANSSLINPVVIILLVFTLLFVAAGTYLYIQRRATGTLTSTKKGPTPKPTPTPTRLFSNSEGKGVYNVSSSQKTGPKISKVIFYPFDVKKGQKFTIDITVSNDVPVQKVTGVLLMDNSKSDLTFTFVSRTEMSELWQATFASLPDSVNYLYSLTVKAESTNGSGVGGASPRSR